MKKQKPGIQDESKIQEPSVNYYLIMRNECILILSAGVMSGQLENKFHLLSNKTYLGSSCE